MARNTEAKDPILREYRLRIGKNLKKIREERLFKSQSELAHILGTTAQKLSRTENGMYAVSADFLAHYAETMKINPDAFFYYDKMVDLEEPIKLEEPAEHYKKSKQETSINEVNVSFNVTTTNPEIINFLQKNLAGATLDATKK